MHLMVIGGAGMIGARLVADLVAKGGLNGRAVTHLTLADVALAPVPEEFSGKVTRVAVDLSAPGVADQLIVARPDVIVHLAAIVSGEAERDFDKGYRINLDGTRALFDAIRAEGLREAYCPRVVFTSSIAVFGAPMPDRIGDEYFRTPLTSYGTQKAICELLLEDYSRRGVFDGVAIRLPTICIRPGVPNKAASGFFSSILREPLVGLEAVLPVPDTTRHYHASPRSAVGFLTHAAGMDTVLLGTRRALTMPGLSATVAEQIEALRAVAGDKAVALIRPVRDEDVATIVAGWPRDFDAARATGLGFTVETSFEQIIRIHIEDALGGTLS